MACQITFSRYLADEDIPEHNIFAGDWYWRSDQQVLDDSGTLVHLIGHRFLQREDEDDGLRPPRYAGNAYLRFLNCLAAGGTVESCSFGACNHDECCEETFESLCNGQFEGNGTRCTLPLCDEEGVCCDFGQHLDCIDLDRLLCHDANGIFVPERSCSDSPPPCDGACCIWLEDVGGGCLDGLGPAECRDLPGSPGAEDLTFSLWRGIGTHCSDDDECPAEGACCTPPPTGSIGCEITTPDECVDDGTPHPPIFMGLGTNCDTDGICGGACCTFFAFGGGDCFDTANPDIECVGVGKTFLGPGTSCENNRGDCGLCCLVDPATCAIVCDEDLLQADCIAAGGTPFGPGSSCEICAFVKRACCVPRFTNMPTPALDDDVDEDDDFCGGMQFKCTDVSDCTTCANMGGIFHREADCSWFPCLLAAGACCCPEGQCPEPPCLPHGPDDECKCFHTLREDCPGGCVWHGPGRGCLHGDRSPFPSVPQFCLVDCDIVGCIPVPDP